MRQSLLKTFDSIWILNLHGNKNKNEKAPDGGPDDNIFGIREGTAIGLFVKHAGTTSDSPARVRYAELWGKLETPNRDGKYDWLERHHIHSHPESHAWTDLSHPVRSGTKPH